MNCATAEPLLPAFRDGEVGPVPADEIAAHVAACVDCTATLAALDEMEQLFAAVSRDDEPVGMAERVATSALRQVVREGPVKVALPRGVLVAAASLALASSAVVALASQPGSSPLHRARSLAGRFGTSVIHAEEKAQQLTAEVRVLRLILASALSGRLEDVSARVEEWRRLQERQRPAAKQQTESNETRPVLVKRCNGARPQGV